MTNNELRCQTTLFETIYMFATEQQLEDIKKENVIRLPMLILGKTNIINFQSKEEVIKYIQSKEDSHASAEDYVTAEYLR